jgi:hypothetical protein
MDEHEPLPKVQLGQLHLSFLGRTFPDATEPWDADLLTLHAVADMRAARVELPSVGIRSGEIAGFVRSLQTLQRDLRGECWLDGSDFGLIVHLKFIDDLGHMRGLIEMRPSGGAEELHRCDFELDQSHLVALIGQCAEVLARFPSKLTPGHGG